MNRAPARSASTLAEIRGLIARRAKHAALAALQDLIAQAPPLGERWGEVLEQARVLGDDDAILAAAEQWIAARPDEPARREARIETLERLARTSDALAEAVELRKLPDGKGAGHFHEGVCLARQAKRDEALEAFYGALEADPTQTRAWDYIAVLKKFAPGDPDLRSLQSAYRKRQSGDPNMLAPVIHALGKAHDDMGHQGRAFEKFKEVGDLMRRWSPYDVAPPVRYCGRLADTFSRGFFERASVRACDSPMPLFIVGPPRSGTTLLERMIATHPDIAAGGEHTLLRIATYPLGNLEPFELRAAFGADRNVFAECGSRYVARAVDRFGDGPRITDKTPLNHFFVGVLNIMLPNARIIWARRDLRDTAWSCFRTRIQGNRWTEDIDDTVAYLKAYDRLMSHWKTVLGERLLVVDYERLVEDPGTVMNEVFGHAGVEWDDGWKTFHETDSEVSTASLGQVRSPLNRRSVGAWRRYEKYLRRPFAALEPSANA